MTASVHILGFSGSLRADSFNTTLLKITAQNLPDGVTLEIFDLAPIPLYNADISEPDAVKGFKSRIAAADALLIATPEYNHSIPGVLKNALDWASRPYPMSVLYDKPVAVMSAAGGSGGMWAQSHLRQILVAVNMHPLNRPQLAVARVREKFDAQGNLLDESIRENLSALMLALREWTLRLKTG